MRAPTRGEQKKTLTFASLLKLGVDGLIEKHYQQLVAN
jgi:hypothetical protein